MRSFPRVSLGLLTAAVFAVSAGASATTTQPNGLVVPRDSANGEKQLYTFFSERGEPIDWLKDSNTTPDTFAPLCGFSAEFLLHEAGSSFAVGWYNADPAATKPPASTEIYTIVPAGSALGTKIVGTDIVKDPKYKGGLIGFALLGGQIHYSERKWNVVCTACTPAAPWITSVTYQSKKFTNAYYLAFEDGNVSGSGFGNDGDYNDDVFLFTGIACPGSGTKCDTGKKGLCALGANSCSGGKLTCKDVFAKGAKRCNGLDNDCDGVLDDGPCPDGTICTRGACIPACGVGEFKCTGGLVCDKGVCVDPPCVGKTCPDGKTCVKGDCVDACDGVKCPAGQLCNAGVCIDLCSVLTCAAGEVCEEGLCKPDCNCAGCPAGKACDKATKHCVPPPCVGKVCAPGTTCDPTSGACVDACTGVVCPKGQECTAGKCAPVVAGDAGVDASGDDASVDDAGLDFDGGSLDDGSLGDGGAGGDAALADATPHGVGCGCRVGEPAGPAAPMAAACAIGAALLRRRRGLRSAGRP